MHWILASLNEYQSRNQSNDIKFKTLQKVKDGGTPFLAPIGYLNKQDLTGGGKGKRYIEVDQDRAPHIQWAFEAYANGQLLTQSTARRADRTRIAKKGDGEEASATAASVTPAADPDEAVLHGRRDLQGCRVPGQARTADFTGDLREGAGGARPPQRVRRATLAARPLPQGLGLLRNLRIAPDAHACQRQRRCVSLLLLPRSETQRRLLLAEGDPIDVLEQVVEEFWQGVRMNPKRGAELDAVVREDLSGAREEATRERNLQQRRLQQFDTERKKLLDAYYAGAVPMDLLRSEQSRIGTEILNAKKRMELASRAFDDIDLTVRRAIRWASNLPEAYVAADDKLRRQLNQAVFKRLLVWEGGVAAYEYTEGMELLFEDIHTIRRDRRHSSSHRCQVRPWTKSGPQPGKAEGQSCLMMSTV